MVTHDLNVSALDCVIVGGGPAGLTAAIYLGRFKRRLAVIDAGESRLLQIPLSRSVPGFPGGIVGKDLHQLMREQAQLYGASFVANEVKSIKATPQGFCLEAGEVVYRAKAVLLATGVSVTYPAMDDVAGAIASSVVRICPICDGFETQDKCVAVLAGRPGAIQEAVFLQTYARDVTFLRAHDDISIENSDEELAQKAGIRIEFSPVNHLARHGSGIAVQLRDGQRLSFDALYPCLGMRPRNQLLARLGGALSATGGIVTDRHQETGVRGIFAAGDVVEGLDQIASACGQAVVAATTIHNRFNSEEYWQRHLIGRRLVSPHPAVVRRLCNQFQLLTSYSTTKPIRLG